MVAWFSLITDATGDVVVTVAVVGDVTETVVGLVVTETVVTASPLGHK